MDNWSDLWGTDTCDRIKFVNIIGAELIVLTNDHNMAAYVKKISKSVLEGINRLLDGGQVKYITVVISRDV